MPDKPDTNKPATNTSDILGTRSDEQGLKLNDTWDSKFRNKHVDTNLQSTEFLSSYRTVIYSRPAKDDAKQNVDNLDSTAAAEFRAIGVVTAWQFSESRNVDRIFELGSDIPYLIPGYTMGQISIQRVMLNGSDVVNALYHGTQPNSANTSQENNKNMGSIKDITFPIDILFVAFPTNGSGEAKYSKVFKNCQISSRNESVTAGQVVIAEGVQIEYETIVGITLPK